MHLFANAFLFGLLGSLGTVDRAFRPSLYCINGEDLGGIAEDTAASAGELEPAKEILMLPPSIGMDGEISRTINLGETISLEELGPIIINADGTTRRITNWDTLSKVEQESSWRVISARNLKRLKALQNKLANRNLAPSIDDPEIIEKDRTPYTD